MKNILILFLISTCIYGQSSDLISDEDLCSQIKSAIKYLKADKELKTQSIRIDSKIGNGWNYNIFSSEYAAFNLGIKMEDFYDMDNAQLNPLFQKLENVKRAVSELKLDCLSKKRKPNAELSKLDKNNLLVKITTKNMNKEGANGMTYLFFFDNTEISKVYKKTWIE